MQHSLEALQTRPHPERELSLCLEATQQQLRDFNQWKKMSYFINQEKYILVMMQKCGCMMDNLQGRKQHLKSRPRHTCKASVC